MKKSVGFSISCKIKKAIEAHVIDMQMVKVSSCKKSKLNTFNNLVPRPLVGEAKGKILAFGFAQKRSGTPLLGQPRDRELIT